jgi:ABC-type multidrug transport system fused ATPase/permease subunit
LIKTLSLALSLLDSKNKNLFFVIIFLSFLSMCLEVFGVSLIIPFVSVILIDDIYNIHHILNSIFGILGNPSKNQVLTYGILFLLLFFFFKSLFFSFIIFFQGRFLYNLKSRISCHLFRSYLNQPFIFFSKVNLSLILRNVRSEADLFIEIVMLANLSLFTELMLTFGLLFSLFYFEPQGAIIIFCFILTTILFFQLLTKKFTKKFSIQRQYYDGLCLETIHNSINDIINIKIKNLQNNISKKFQFFADSSARAQRYQWSMQELPRLWLEFICLASLILLVLVLFLKDKLPNEIIATLSLFGVAAFKILPSLNRIFVALQKIRFGKPVIEIVSLSKELDKTAKYFPLNNLRNNTIAFNNTEPFLKIEDLSFGYDKLNLIDSLNFNLTNKKIIGIYGNSGSGKSTLVNNILGLLKPSKGKITHFGIELEECLYEFHKKVSYVPQNVVLINGTILENIVGDYSENKIDEKNLKTACEIAELNNFVDINSSGLQVHVNNNSLNISGGQKQRIGIARAIYNLPELLVLDESLNSIDNETIKKIFNHFSSVAIRYILIISHDLNVLKNCDVLYKFENRKLNLINKKNES